MKQNLQRKINAYRQAKNTKQSFDGFLDQKKKNLKKLLQQQSQAQNQNDFAKLEKQNKYSSTNQFTKKLQLKQQQYFKQMEQIQNLKLQAIQKNNDLQNLKIQMSFQRKSYQNLIQRVKQEKKQNNDLIQKISQKQLKQIKEIKKVYQDRLKKNFQHYQQLLSQKAQQNQRMLKFVSNKKKFEKDMKQLKQNHEKSLKENKALWLDQQNQTRSKWQQQKKQQIMQNTLKGIEPQIQRIVGSSKNEIKKIEQKYQIMREQYRDERNKQFEKKSTQMRNQSFSIIEQQKMRILSQYSQKLNQQFEALEEQFQKDRKKIRGQRQEEIKQLEEKRKNQTQEFIFKNKDFYTIHLQEVKLIKEEYEEVIKELDGQFELQIQKQEDVIRAKYNQKLQRQRQAQRKSLQFKIKNFTINYQKQSQSLYQDLVQKVAVQNNTYQTQIRSKTQQHLKQIKQNFQSQTKHFKKTINLLDNKYSNLCKQTITKKQERQNSQESFQQIKRDNQYLQKKYSQYQNDLHLKKVAIQNNLNIEQHPQLKKIQDQWLQQINNAKQAYKNLKVEVQQSEQIMAEKISELRNKYGQTVNVLEKNSLKLFNLKKNQVAKLKADKQMLQKYSQGLDQMLKKQKVLLQKFQEQQKSISTKKSSLTK